MLRRRRKAESRSREPGAGVFEGLRNQVLTLDASSVGLLPNEDLPHVFGVVMDTTYREGSATVVALADGTTSLYTSSGGGVIGGGAHATVTRANHLLLVEAEARISEFESTPQPPALPAVGHVNITLLTYGGLRYVAAPEDDLGHGRHPASPVFHAAHSVITELRMIEAARR